MGDNGPYWAVSEIKTHNHIYERNIENKSLKYLEQIENFSENSKENACIFQCYNLYGEITLL